MEDNELQKWALLAEILGGIAVVLSLVFVGLEVRQNSRALEVSAYQDLISQISDVHLVMFSDQDSAGLVERLLRNEISGEEANGQRVRSFMQYTIRHADMAFLQFDNGLITEEQLYSTLAPLRTVLASEQGRKIWRENYSLNSEMTNYVEHQMAEFQPDDPFWNR